MKRFLLPSLFILALLNLLMVLIHINPRLLPGLTTQLSPPTINENNDYLENTYPTVRSYSADTNNPDGAVKPSSQMASAVSSMYRVVPERTGMSAGSVLALPMEIEWRTGAINIGVHTASKSSPAVDDTGVYVGADSGVFYKFSLAGKTLWRFEVESPGRGIHGTALLDQENVYFGAYNGRFYCLRKSTGDLLWVVKLADAIGSSSLSFDNAMYVSVETAPALNGYLYKLDRRNGSVLWRSIGLGEQVHSSPTMDQQRQTLFLGANNGHLYAISATTSDVLWTTDLGGPVKDTPVFKNGIVYATSWGKRFWAVDAKTGAVLWSADLGGTSQSSPTLIPNAEIAVVGTKYPASIQGISLKQKKVIWKISDLEQDGTQVLGSGVTTPISSGGNQFAVWIACGAQKLCALNPLNGLILQKLNLPGSLSGVPSVYDNSLFVALNKGPLIRLRSAAKRPLATQARPTTESGL